MEEIYLTNSNKRVTFDAGYYESFSVSTEIGGSGTVSYKHHVHSTISNNEYILTDSATSTTEGDADGYRSPTEGGCYTNPVYGTKRVKCGEWEVTSGSGDGYWNYRCSGCGAYKRDDGGGDHTYTTTDYNNILGYTATCGRQRGQIVEAIITY